MPVIRNHYKVLGLDYSATDRDIREAYRALAKKYHPDVNQGDAEAAAKFRDVSDAYDCLRDHDQRAMHDVLLESKGINTGAFTHYQEDVPLVDDEPVTGERPRTTVKKAASSNKKKKGAWQGAPPRTRAERTRAAMALHRAKKRFMRNMIIVGAAVVFLFAVGGLFIGLWQGGMFNPRHTITFIDGETQVAVARVREGSRIPQRFNVRPGQRDENVYRFDGWSTRSDVLTPWDFQSRRVTSSGGGTDSNSWNLYARWTRLGQPMTVTLHFPDPNDPSAAPAHPSFNIQVIDNRHTWTDIRWGDGVGFQTLFDDSSLLGWDIRDWVLRGTDIVVIDPTRFPETRIGLWGSDPRAANIEARWQAQTRNVSLVSVNIPQAGTPLAPPTVLVSFDTAAGGLISPAIITHNHPSRLGWYTAQTGGIRVANGAGVLEIDISDLATELDWTAFINFRLYARYA
ncbi:MAG: J domain-containing protein [Firmicutes bacterium]|nr:J domain-containing protein [Bacillota bacterium]